MGTLVVGTFLSLDGVMQAPGGPEEDPSGGFELGGWLVPHFDEVLGRVMIEHHTRADAVLLGRRSYEILSGHWPRVGDDDPMAAKLNSVPKYVASSTLDAVEYRLWVFPVLLGSGKRLFADGTRPAGLMSTSTSGTGVTIQAYRRAGAVRQGSFLLDDQG